jgi:hypothetical protein
MLIFIDTESDIDFDIHGYFEKKILVPEFIYL